MKKSVKKELVKIDEDVKSYMSVLEALDKDDKKHTNSRVSNEDIIKLSNRKKQLQKDLDLLEILGKDQYNKTDKDATVMSKPAHNLMAYNSQIAVDSKYKFILATDISTNGHDLDQLHNMATKSKEIVDNPNMIVTADKGYYSSKEIKKCVDNAIETIVPLRNTATKKKIQNSKFSKNQFTYDKIQDCYTCPNNQELKKIEKQYLRNGRMLDVYRISSSFCKVCPLKKNCLSDVTPNKQVYRWEHDDIIDNYTTKMNTKRAKEIVKKRGSIVEHPFGTIKRTLGWDHFLVRSKKKVLGENALIMFTYNFKRLLNLIGIALKVVFSYKKQRFNPNKQRYRGTYLDVWSLFGLFFRNIFIFTKFSKKDEIF